VVSLRDVARCVKLFSWFRINFLKKKSELESESSAESGTGLVVKALMLALAHCYYFRLQEGEPSLGEQQFDRGAYRRMIEGVCKKYVESSKGGPAIAYWSYMVCVSKSGPAIAYWFNLG
jgi:hypothetical protein